MDPSELTGPSLLDEPTLVLNRSWLPVHVTPVRRAIAMLFRGTANAIHAEELSVHDFRSWLDVGAADRPIRTSSRAIRAPEVVQLLSYDRVPVYQAPFTRAGVFRRDDYTCQYCGARRPVPLTIDHVLPRSRGGTTSWINCVVACVRCNSKKGDRMLGECGLRLRARPRAPRWTPAFDLRSSEFPRAWSRFLPTAPRRAATGS